MEKSAQPSTRKSAASRKSKPFLDQLIYERLDGQPIYYRAFKDVQSGEKKLEDVMGSSALQGVFISILLDFLYANIDRRRHYIVTNEIGLHINKRNNLSSDIAIYDRDSLKSAALSTEYLQIAPLVVLEVDTKADAAEVARLHNWNYYNKKTQKLLAFGVKEVVWIFTETKQVMTASSEQDWITSSWSREITLLGSYKFSIDSLLRADGLINPDDIAPDGE